MADRAFAYRSAVLLGVLGVAVGWASMARAQSININYPLPGGIVVDPEGVLKTKVVADPEGALLRTQVAAAKATLSRDLIAYSKLRKVSLNRLEKALVERQGVLTDPMRYLAGLLRVRYVFYYPETKDIVLAGPAEGWITDAYGRVVGISSWRPVIQLQDLVVALRTFPAGQKSQTVITCSIDPTQEGLAAMQSFLRKVGGFATPADTQRIVDGLRTSLGLQNIAITGVSPKTNFARVLVEADYRMKCIGIGLEPAPVRLTSFVQQVNPAQVSRNALFRWFFVPDYQCVRMTEDGLAMELVGDGVKLIGEDEMVSASGGRAVAGKQNRASQAWTTGFTKRYAEIADRSAVFAELRNVIDLSVVAAFMQQQDLYGKAGWSMPIFGSEKDLPVETLNAPKHVESAVAAIWKGNRLTTPIGGGVHIQPGSALSKANLLPDDKGTVSKIREELKLKVPEGQWWWD